MMNAFSMKWPYLCYANESNGISILNAFSKNVVHRITIAPKMISLIICETYITNTQDLFVIAFKFEDNKYYIYMLDLDECNFMEIEDNDFTQLDKAFNFNDEIFSYHHCQVQ